MSQVENHLKWCLNDERRLIKAKPDMILAQKHLKKSEYNYGIVQTLEKMKELIVKVQRETIRILAE